MKTVRGWLTHAFNEIRLEEVPYPDGLHSSISFFRRSDTTGANERSNAHTTLFLSERGVIRGSESLIRLGYSGFGVDNRTLFPVRGSKDPELQRRGARAASKEFFIKKYSDLCALCASYENTFTQPSAISPN